MSQKETIPMLLLLFSDLVLFADSSYISRNGVQNKQQILPCWSQLQQ